MQLVNKRLFAFSNTYFKEFYDIPYKDDFEDYTKTQLLLIKNNRQYFQFHTSWFVAMAMHHCVDLVGNYERCKVEDRKNCEQLKCPPMCGKIFTQYDNAMLLKRTIGLRDEQYEELLKPFDLSLFKHAWIYLISHCIIIGLDQKTIVTLPRMVLYDMYLISTFPSESYKFNEDILTTVTSLVNKKIISEIRSSLGCLQLIINKPEVRIKNVYAAIYPLMKYITNNFQSHGEVVDDIKISDLLILRVSSDTVVKFIVSHSKIVDGKRYLWTNECITVKYQITCYTIINCLVLIGNLSGIKIPTPQVFLGDYGVSILILPSGATTVYNNSEFSKLGPSSLLEAFAIFTTVSYLFGLHRKQVAYSKGGIFHIDYNKIYEKDKIRLGTIITTLGGRKTALYKQFLYISTEYYLRLRKYYLIARMLLSVLRIKREVIDQRFQPQLNDSHAREFFAKKLKDMGDIAVKNWKLLGY
jgi:hypothetical protein